MEVLLKGSALPLSHRNLQVAFISLILATARMLTSDGKALASSGFFQGYSPAVFGMVSLDSMGGLLVSMLLKYTSATLKNFASPIGIILNVRAEHLHSLAPPRPRARPLLTAPAVWQVLLNRYVFRSNNFQPSRNFMLGTLLVLLGLGCYTSSA